ncbi:hypothetical protein PFLA_b1082 [Pseudoalteromonas flavipulchra NCIMB 2033 = ATCC BAA-314]|nr:hypothetical protein [Pseudoalteromonas flavipulchra NCIMB 2033 = ATCC BAA-314]
MLLAGAHILRANLSHGRGSLKSVLQALCNGKFDQATYFRN